MERRHATKALFFVLALAGAACQPAATPTPTSASAAARGNVRADPLVRPGAVRVDTAHYSLSTTASPAQTQAVGAALESLHRAYLRFFDLSEPVPAPGGRRLQVVLYRDRSEFVAYNRSHPWAEAYYLKPYCHAYLAGGQPNPHHWVLHEATHQLNAEVAGQARAKWINEGLATYFGASRLSEGELQVGRIDPDAYPIWWLRELDLSGSLQADLTHKRVIPLRELIQDSGPPMGGYYLNRYYLQYWSLTHFLFHHDGGRYAGAYRRLIRGRGSLAEFERELGPWQTIQAQWYSYLLARREQAARDFAAAAPEPSSAQPTGR